MDSALSNKEEGKSELEKRLENGHRDSENLRASEYQQKRLPNTVEHLGA